jgi:hypothetical protein
MNRGRVGEERGGNEMDRCPFTEMLFAPAQVTDNAEKKVTTLTSLQWTYGS